MVLVAADKSMIIHVF